MSVLEEVVAEVTLAEMLATDFEGEARALELDALIEASADVRDDLISAGLVLHEADQNQYPAGPASWGDAQDEWPDNFLS